MKELLEKAQVAELGQHLPVAQNLLGEQDAAQVVAFLLKQYFGQQANSLRDLGEVPAAQPAAVPDAQADAAEGSSNGRRKRRRRGRRRGGEQQDGDFEHSAESAGQPPAAPRQATAAYDIIDAVVLLGGAPAPSAQPAAPVAERQPTRRKSSSQSGPSQGQGQGRQRSERGGRRRERSNESFGQDRSQRGNRQSGGRSEAPLGDDDSRGNLAPAKKPSAAAAAPLPPAPEGMAHIRVNIGFDDGFKGRGSVAKRVAALAGLNEGALSEVESRREFAILRATVDIAEMVLDRVDGAQLGKKVIEVQTT